jgi:hypothetical protein
MKPGMPFLHRVGEATEEGGDERRCYDPIG